jgi:serine/threonine protein kinase
MFVSFILAVIKNIIARREILYSKKSDIELLNSARLGTDDYEFDSVEIIKEGGQAVVFSVKSKIDGKIYAAKRLDYNINSKFKETKKQAAAEKEICGLRALNHPMIIEMIDLVKD